MNGTPPAGSLPVFLLSRRRLLANLHRFAQWFPSADVHYAVKANSAPEVLSTFLSADAGFEVASPGELALLDSLEPDLPAKRVLFGTAVKPAASIVAMRQRGLDRFVADAPEELEKLAAIAPGANVLVRVRVDDRGSVFTMSEKFGCAPEEAAGLLVEARRLGLVPHGLSFNVGSQATNPRAWADALDLLAPVAVGLQRNGIELAAINIGGGFPCSYPHSRVADLAEISGLTLEAFDRWPYQPWMLLEPGRALVANAAVLLTTVIARIDRPSGTWLYLDAGVYNALFEALACQGSTHYPVTRLGDSGASPLASYILAGPTGDGLDVIDMTAQLPADIAEGDQLVLEDVGAYGSVLSSGFNGFAPVASRLIDDFPWEAGAQVPAQSTRAVVPVHG